MPRWYLAASRPHVRDPAPTCRSREYGPASSCRISFVGVVIEKRLCSHIESGSVEKPLSKHQRSAAMTVEKPSPAEETTLDHRHSATVPHLRQKASIKTWKIS